MRKGYPLLLALLLLAVGAACERDDSSTGNLEVRIWDHREAIGDFSELWLVFSTVAIHPAGQPRTEGWLELEPSTQEVDLTRYIAGSEAVIVQATVVAGLYDAVRLTVNRATGTLENGQPVEVDVRLTPLALNFGVRNGRTTIVGLDLVVLDVSDHPGRSYELHIREGSIREGIEP